MADRDLHDYPICVMEVNLSCCDRCPLKIKNTLKQIKGVYAINISPVKGQVTVHGVTKPSKLTKALESIGKKAEICNYDKNPKKFKNRNGDSIKSPTNSIHDIEQDFRNMNGLGFPFRNYGGFRPPRGYGFRPPQPHRFEGYQSPEIEFPPPRGYGYRLPHPHRFEGYQSPEIEFPPPPGYGLYPPPAPPGYGLPPPCPPPLDYYNSPIPMMVPPPLTYQCDYYPQREIVPVGNSMIHMFNDENVESSCSIM